MAGVAATGWLPYWPAAAVFFIAFAAYLWLVRQLARGEWQPTLVTALAVAAIVRAVCLPHPPVLSDDIYRYLHEGRLVLEGINPYTVAPADVAEPLRGPYWSQINNPEIAAAYPPAVQYALAAGAWISPHPIGVKLIFGGLDLLLFWLLWCSLPALGGNRRMALVHGLSPLMAIEFAGQGHSDSIAALFLILALWAAARGAVALGGAALAVATAGKLMPIVLLPAVVRRRGWVGVLAFAAVLVALYAPFLSSGAGIWSGTLEYSGRWRSNDSMFWLVYQAAEGAVQLFHLGEADSVWLREPQRLAKVPLVGLGLAVLAWCWWRRRSPMRTAFLFIVFFVAATPTLHPWYLALLVPLLCRYPNPGLLVFTGTVFLSYHVLPAWHAEGVWRENPWIKAIEYAPFYAGALWLQPPRPGRHRSVT